MHTNTHITIQSKTFGLNIQINIIQLVQIWYHNVRYGLRLLPMNVSSFTCRSYSDLLTILKGFSAL
jgi:hypothetical protein